jgi:8-oxo-dGTP diphosphatase
MKESGVQYTQRPSVYGILTDLTGRVAVLEEAGQYYLPGGGIEKNETPEEGLKRELIEEMGCQMDVYQFLGQTIDYFLSYKEPVYYCIPASYYLVGNFQIVQKPTEGIYVVHWMDVAEVIPRMARQGFAWAVKETAIAPAKQNFRFDT